MKDIKQEKMIEAVRLLGRNEKFMGNDNDGRAIKVS